MAVKTINISLDEKLLKEVDKAAKAEYASRSDYIRTSVMAKINSNKQTVSPKVSKEYVSFLSEYGQTLKNLADR